MLHLFRLCLQDGARLWFYDFGAQSRDVCYDAVKEAFLAHYKHVEDASDVWHQLKACLQKEDECVDAYAWRFFQLWNRWCIALRGQVPSFMLKKHHFVVGLRGVLKLKVECKRPQNYEDALRIAKDKEWKLKHQQAGVFGNTSMPYGLGSCYGNVNRAPYASSEVKMDSLFVKSEPMPQISSPIVAMGHCVDAIKGVHDVHVDEIEAHVPIEEEKDMANCLGSNHVEEMPIVLNVFEYEHEESVATNVACDEVLFGLCAFDVDNRLTSRTMDVFGVALTMFCWILWQGDDDDWGFDDSAVEMNEEIQPFVDAALGRIWVMREQQSHEVVMNRSEAIHMYGREGGSDVCVGFDYGLANIEIERNLWDMFTMEEDAEHFVEGFELDCILRGIQDQKNMLHLFRLCLQDGARLWFNDFGAQSRDVCYDAVKEAFLAHYKHVEDASDVWHQLKACLQKEDECVDAYAWLFFQLWNRWCNALRGQVPPFMLKKHHFVVGLRGVLKLKVECKRPQNYEDALRIAKDKEWKLKHQQAGVFGNTSMPYGLGSCYGNVNHAPYASSEVKMDSLFVKSEPMPQINSPIVAMGHCVDAIKGVHDVHVDEIEAHVPIEEEKDMANALGSNHVEEMPIVLNVVEYEHEESVAKNVACDEVLFGLCAFDVDNRLTSRTMDVFGVALTMFCDDDDWGFDDPVVEMNEEIQPFVDAALGRIWVMQE
ncbi:hypothetical protein L7F22_028694 [Adiantum nelumboides]|nr:hypothetical protein [Adiantum nelumboides]